MMGFGYDSQREQDERMGKMKSINEVEALRGVFYSFFEVKGLQEGDETNDKVLISMQAPNVAMNPFIKFNEEKGEEDMNY